MPKSNIKMENLCPIQIFRTTPEYVDIHRQLLSDNENSEKINLFIEEISYTIGIKKIKSSSFLSAIQEQNNSLLKVEEEKEKGGGRSRS